MTMTVGERIRLRRKELCITADELALKVGVSRSTIFRYESGGIEKLPVDALVPIAQALRTTPSFLMGWAEESSGSRLPSPTIATSTVSFPVLGEIAAGYDAVAVPEDWRGETIEVPVSYLSGRPASDYFVLEIKGDSMYPLYHSGDYVLVLRQHTLNRSGEIGAVLYEDDCATLKKVEYVMGEDWMRLVPVNPSYPPVTIEGERLEHCRILGIPRVLVRRIND